MNAGKTVLAGIAVASLYTIGRPMVYREAPWSPPTMVLNSAAAFQTQARASGAREYPTVNVGDTITIQFTTSNADTACFKALGGSRLVVRKCSAGGFHVYMRGYVRKIAISADSVSYATGPQLATMATACDSAMTLMGIRGDVTLDPSTLPSPACDVYRARIQATLDSIKAATKPPD